MRRRERQRLRGGPVDAVRSRSPPAVEVHRRGLLLARAEGGVQGAAARGPRSPPFIQGLVPILSTRGSFLRVRGVLESAYGVSKVFLLLERLQVLA